jgi:hypothetical protein
MIVCWHPSVDDLAMADSDQLRKRASQLFAMALKARETGFAAATELEKLASESLAQAEDMDRQTATPKAPQQDAQQPQPLPTRRNRPLTGAGGRGGWI